MGFLYLTGAAEIYGNFNDKTKEMSIDELAEYYEKYDGSFAFPRIGCVIYGLASFAIAAVGILYFLQEKANMPQYGQYIGRFVKGLHPGVLVGGLGVAATIVMTVGFAGGQEKYYSISYSGLPGQSALIMLAIYALLGGISFIASKQDMKRR